ncbi:hypothetical protein MMC13_001139 [Lambiella insularis]|nr:hypothetical protein [Lambiella insularis]
MSSPPTSPAISVRSMPFGSSPPASPTTSVESTPVKASAILIESIPVTDLTTSVESMLITGSATSKLADSTPAANFAKPMPIMTLDMELSAAEDVTPTSTAHVDSMSDVASSSPGPGTPSPVESMATWDTESLPAGSTSDVASSSPVESMATGNTNPLQIDSLPTSLPHDPAPSPPHLVSGSVSAVRSTEPPSPGTVKAPSIFDDPDLTWWKSDDGFLNFSRKRSSLPHPAEPAGSSSADSMRPPHSVSAVPSAERPIFGSFPATVRLDDPNITWWKSSDGILNYTRKRSSSLPTDSLPEVGLSLLRHPMVPMDLDSILEPSITTADITTEKATPTRPKDDSIRLEDAYSFRVPPVPAPL